MENTTQSERPFLGDKRAAHEQASEKNGTPQTPKQDIPSFVQIIRILLWTTSQYMIILLPVVRLCVAVAVGMLTVSKDDDRNERPKTSGPNVK